MRINPISVIIITDTLETALPEIDSFGVNKILAVKLLLITGQLKICIRKAIPQLIIQQQLQVG